jgi:hypothetical protein
MPFFSVLRPIITFKAIFHVLCGFDSVYGFILSSSHWFWLNFSERGGVDCQDSIPVRIKYL